MIATSHDARKTKASPRISACPFADNLEVAMPVSTTLKVWVDSAVRQAIYVPWLVLSITLPLPSTVLKNKNLERSGKGEIRLNTSPQ
jgi:hypothetical protein